MKIYNYNSTTKQLTPLSTDGSNAIITDTNGVVGQAGLPSDTQTMMDYTAGGVQTLIGADTNKSARTIAAEEVAEQLVPENAGESLDTLQEIAAWIQSHPGDAASMNQRITSLETAVPFTLYIQNGVYGYKDATNTFIPFKSQADIDAAVTAAKVGTATAADVLAGKTFTNATTSGVTGTMIDHDAATNAVSVGTNNTNTYHRIPTGAYLKLQGTGYPEIVTPLTEYGDAAAGNVLSGKKFTSSAGLKATGTMPSRSLGTAATGSGIDSTGPYVYIPYGHWPEYSGKAGSSYTYMTAAQAVAACPKQERSCTPSTSAQTVSPDSGKLLSKVTVNAISTQEKSTKPTTNSTTAATVTPDSGKYLTKVTVDTTSIYATGKTNGKTAAMNRKASYSNTPNQVISVTSGNYIIVAQLGQTSYCSISTSGASVTFVGEEKAVRIYKATSTGSLTIYGNGGKNISIIVLDGLA